MTTQMHQDQQLRLLDLSTHAVRRSRPASHTGGLTCVKKGLLDSRYEVRSGDRFVAELSLRGILRPTASARSDDGAWFFEPEGRAIVVRTQDRLRDLAVVDLSFSDHGGILRIPDGRTYLFLSYFWKGRAEFQTPSGQSLVRYRFRGLLRPHAKIEILDAARAIPELNWIVLLGWSLIVGSL